MIGYSLSLKYITIIYKDITCSVCYIHVHVLCSPLYCDYRSGIGLTAISGVFLVLYIGLHIFIVYLKSKHEFPKPA